MVSITIDDDIMEVSQAIIALREGIESKRIRIKGGPGSGHHGHQGRPGKRGGSLPGSSSGGMLSTTEMQTALRNLSKLHTEEAEWVRGKKWVNPQDVGFGGYAPIRGFKQTTENMKAKAPIEEIKLSDIAATQPYIPYGGLEAYIKDYPSDRIPLILRDSAGVYSVQTGHTRLGVLMLAGRDTVRVHVAYLNSNNKQISKKRYKITDS